VAVTQVRRQQIADELTAGDFAAASVDGAAGTASLRTLGTGAQQAAAGDHTHTAFGTLSITGPLTLDPTDGVTGFADKGGQVYNAKAYGALGSGKAIFDAYMTGGSPTLDSLGTSRFAASDAGAAITVEGAGAAGGPLVTTILTYNSPTQVTLAANAVTGVGGVSTAAWGVSNDTAYIQAALDAARDAGGGVVKLPPGIYGVSAELVLYDNVHLVGSGMGVTYLWLMNSVSVSSTLNGAITSSATSLVLASAASFPTAGVLLQNNEVIVYTGKSTNTLTGLKRGYDGTTAIAGSNGDTVRLLRTVVKTFDFEALTWTLAIAGPTAWSIRELTIHGNRANNTYAGWGVLAYGWGFHVENVTIRFCRRSGWYSEWTDAAYILTKGDLQEAHVSGLFTRDNGRHGLHWNGPHDSQLSQTLSFQNNLDSGGGDGVVVGPLGFGTQFATAHSWGNSQRYGWNVQPPLVMLDNCVGEGATTAHFNVACEDMVMSGCLAYGAGSTLGTAKGLVLASGGVAKLSLTAGGGGFTAATVAFSGGGGSGARAVARVSGGAVQNVVLIDPGSGYTSAPGVTVSGDGSGATATAAINVAGLNADVKLVSCGGGSVDLAGDRAFNRMRLQAYQASGAAVIGSLSATSELDIHVAGGATPKYEGANVRLADRGGQVFNAKAFGARGDTRTFTDAAITSGAAVLTSATAAFTPADVGKAVEVVGAGASTGAAAGCLVTTVLSYQSATQVTLSANAAATVSGATAFVATNDAAAIQAALDAARDAGGHEAFLPPGVYTAGSTLTLYSFVHLRGAGVEATFVRKLGGSVFDVFKTYNFDSLTGTNAATNSSFGEANWGIYDMTVGGGSSRDNAATTTLSSDPGAGGTTVSVASTTGFPATDGTVRIDSEVIQYAGVTGTTFTGCTRGAWGTTAAAHTVGVVVKNRPETTAGVKATTVNQGAGIDNTTNPVAFDVTSCLWWQSTGSVRVDSEVLTYTIPITTLTANATSGDTTITVAGTTNFGATGKIRVDNEVIQYTGVGATTFTGCTRGSGGTLAAAHTSGTAATSTTRLYNCARAQNATTIATHANGATVTGRNTADRPVNGAGLRAYGYGFTLERFRVRNARGDGAYLEWATQTDTPSKAGIRVANDAMQAHIDKVVFHDSGENGLHLCGPHDSRVSNGDFFNNLAAGARVYADARKSGAGAQFTTCHSWGNGQTYAYELRAASVILSNVVGEGASIGQVLVAANDCILSPLYLYDIGQLNKGLIIGETASATTASGLMVDAKIVGCTTGAIDFSGDGGSNIVRASVYQASGTVAVGTPAATTFPLIAVSGGAAAPVAFPLTRLPSQTQVYDPTNSVYFKVSTGGVGQVVWQWLEASLDGYGGITQFVATLPDWHLGKWNNTTGFGVYTGTAYGLALHVDSAQRVGLFATASASYGLLQVGGSSRLQALGTPAAPTTSVGGGTPAGATDFYFVVAEDRAGYRTLASAASSSAARGSSAANWRKVVWTAVAGAVKYYVLVNTSSTAAATTLMTLTGTWVPGAITGVSALTGGTGGTNGTFTDGTFVGGGGTGGTFAYTIAGGIVTNICVLNAGSAYTGQPAFTMPSKGALAGFSATANIAAYSVGGGTNLEADDSGQAINGAFTLPTYNATADETIDGRLSVGTAAAPTAVVTLGAGAAAANSAPLKFTSGTNLTTAEAGAAEFDGTSLYSTVDTTNGRRAWDGWNYFRLTGSGTGITTIADFFGANSAIPLVANGVYEIEWVCYFSQATAGTATWTITTATTNLANLTGEYVGSPVGGIGAVGTPQTAGVNVTASSSTAFPVTGTEATAATHYFRVRVLLTAGNGASNVRLRLTMSAGTATPLINSFFRVRRLPGSNTGAFVA
jgi:hypothetical protein